MNNYTFHTLNDKEFEELARDLLNKKFGLALQSFKKGKDGGVDLRFSTSTKDNSLVVQVKHFVGSGFTQLKRVLINDELDKVKKLSPDRYLVVTSVPLNPIQKSQLKTALAPFVLTANDIIGAEDLNTYLGEFPEIERQYFKLWFSSVTVLEQVINNAVSGRTVALLKKIEQKIPFYVITRKLDDANSILMRQKILLITGQPGIGKTTLADILLYEKAKNDFQIYQVFNITEAEDVMNQNAAQKQVFYFDDFLGANYSEIVNAHKTETQLTSFVERVKNAPNKYLILTTRTIILNYAVERYEKISHSGLNRKQFEIILNDYSKLEKAQILYNHLYFKKIDQAFFDQVTRDHFYRKIVAHKNYTPRIIDFITDENRLADITAEQYPQYIIDNLNTPKDIWRHSFINQIDHTERCFLLTLFTFENGATESLLNAAFQSRMRFEKDENNSTISGTQFDDSLQVLLNGFIMATLVASSPPNRQFNFINPSLADFLIGYVNGSFNIRRELISSIAFTDQLKRFDPGKGIIPFETELQVIIRDAIAANKITVLSRGDKNFTGNNRTIALLETLCQYCPAIPKDNVLLALFEQLDLTESFVTVSSKLFYILCNLGSAPGTKAYIQENFEWILPKLIGSTDDDDDAKLVPHLFDLFNQNYDKYAESDEGFAQLIDMMEAVLTRYEEASVDELKSDIRDIESAKSLYDELASMESLLKSKLFPDTHFHYDFGISIDIDYWESIIEENNQKADYESDRLDYDYEIYRENQYGGQNEDRAIDNLFDD